MAVRVTQRPNRLASFFTAARQLVSEVESYFSSDEDGNLDRLELLEGRLATCLLQGYENGDVNTIENDIINPLENPTNRAAGTSAVATSSRARVSSISRPGEAVRQSLREAFPLLSGNSGKRKSDFKSKQGIRSKAPTLTKKKTCNVVYKDLILLPEPDTKTVPTHRSRITLENDGFVVHEFPIDKSLQEEEFKAEVRKVFPILVSKCANFKFAKACYGEIVSPKVADRITMNAARVLSISGQGRIYLRPDKVLHETSEEVDGDSDLDRCPWDTQEDDLEDVKTPERPLTPEPQTVADSDGLPSTSSGASAMDQEKSFLVLKEMFPETKEEVLKLAYDCSNSLEEAASFLADRSSSPELESKSSHMSLELLIEELRGKMSDAFDRKKLRVDEEDLVADAVAFYKRPDFDPKAGVQVVYSGQPASDTGGVSRHFFSDFLHRLSQIYFSGESRKVPLCNTDILISGLMKIIGTIIVHSVLHGGPGFPFFSSALYWYLATGSVDAAIQQLCFDDWANPNYKDVVLKVVMCVHVFIPQAYVHM